MNKALLLIDLQYDFMPGGKLAVSQGDTVVPVANAALYAAKQRGELTIASLDWHPKNHGSFAVNQGVPLGTMGTLNGIPQYFWPAHCIQGSHGAALHQDLDINVIDHLVFKGTKDWVDSYSAFRDNDKTSETGLDAYLRTRGITNLDIMGLATDFCVKATVEDAVAFGYQVRVIQDGCRGVGDHEGTMNFLAGLPGVTIV